VLRHPVENVGLAVGVLAAFGLPTTFGVLRGAGVTGLVVGLALALVGATLEGAFQIWRDDRPAMSESLVPTEPEPLLGLGRAYLPKQPQYGSVEGFSLDHPARLIQVPVVNSQGAGEAVAVHAELNFMPGDRDGQFSPRHPARGEWADDGARPTQVNLPGNGQVYLLNVALVFNDGYPCIYEWTRRSRDANLHGYGMWTTGANVEVVIRAAGPSAPCVRRTLKIEVIEGLIHANWDGTGRSNWVPIQDKGWPERSTLVRLPRPHSEQ
jgi:hypothetical protein